MQCPKVIGDGKSGWALPCLPFANDTGGTLFMPKVGDLVWVEFEEEMRINLFGWVHFGKMVRIQ